MLHSPGVFSYWCELSQLQQRYINVLKIIEKLQVKKNIEKDTVYIN